MALFGKKNEGGVLDVIRCDEEQYLVWKWRPSGDANSTRKENAIRWGSSLRVKDGEVAVFVYKQDGKPAQDFIEGPFDDTIKTANFPVISNIIGLAYAGQSPFQAEVYFINLAGNIKVDFRVPYFDVFDPRFADFPVRVGAGGSFRFNITDYRAFVKLHRLINFEIHQLSGMVRDAVLKYVKGIIANVPAENAIPVLQLERKLLDINDLIAPRVRKVFTEEFGVNLQGFDLSSIEVDKDTKEYEQLRAVTADLEIEMRKKQNEVNMQNLEETQALNGKNLEETLRIQREQTEHHNRLRTEQQFIAAHQVNKQAEVLKTAAAGLGNMGQMDLGGGGFNPVGMLTGLAVGGAMGGQMAQMMNTVGNNIQQPLNMPPPPPQVAFHLAINGQNMGPFNMAQLQQMVATGQLTQNVHAWRAGMANWELAGTIPELAGLFAPPPPPHTPPPVPPSAG